MVDSNLAYVTAASKYVSRAVLSLCEQRAALGLRVGGETR
jgi:hypothetical protein